MTQRRPVGTSARQYGAIPVRTGADGTEILLVTSRGARRWIIPKGWPGRGMSPADSAAREVFEEAGVRGDILGDAPLGSYPARKRIGSRIAVLHIEVFVLRVTVILAAWPESRERERGWFRPDVAASLVDEPELGDLIGRAAAMLCEDGHDRVGQPPLA